ncbi:VWA domain-containing protein [Lutibacter sp. B2]|nr:VWA domain-containing protein [Lutibacter sp. B2]
MHLNTQIDIKILIFSMLILGYFIFQGFRFYNIFPKKKFWTWIVLRVLGVICIALVLMKAEMVLTSQNTTTLFLVDRSLSVDQNKSEIEEYINAQIKDEKSKDSIGVITFGKEPMIELPISKEVKTVRLETKLDAEFTNIQKALEFAINYFPENKNKKLVIFTDGKENMGDCTDVVNVLKDENVNMMIYPLKSKKRNDVQLTNLHIPANIHKGERVPITVTIDSNIITDGTLYLFNGNEKIVQKELKVKSGVNNFEFIIAINRNGSIDLRGEIKFKGDTNLKNNIFTKTIIGKEQPKILVLGNKEDTKNLEKIVESLEINYENYDPKQVPDTIEFLSRFDIICLVNGSHEELTKEFEMNLEQCVKEQGTGFVVIGGEKTFALGGYKGTVLEKILPVESRMKGNKKQPNTGLVLIIDASGSMADESGGIKKIEMAKEAAIRSIEILEADDYVGVLAFSDRVEWIVPFEQVKDKEKIKKDIGKLGSKGGTLIKPALQKSLATLENADTKVKHIILLTDGQGEKKGYEEILNGFKDNKITVSTVAFGKDADQKLLEDISESTKGRNYYSVDFHSIPEIFARETYLATKKYINNREFRPQIVNEAEFFKNKTIPKLKGYMGTGIKNEANIILKSDMDDPILAHWRYGLGNVIVWTSDLNGKWSNEWIQWIGLQNQWSSIIDYCLPQYRGKDMNIDITQRGANVNVFLDTGVNDSNQMMKAILQGPENSKKEIPLHQVMAGKFKDDFNLDQKGDYAINFRLSKEDKVIKNAKRIIHFDYSPEYALDDSKHIPLYINASMIDKDTKVFDLPMKRKNRSNTPLDYILFPLALILFITELWMRKR